MGELTEKQARQVWLEAQERVKDKVIAPTLYRALEMGVGITLDGDYFVLGFTNADMPMSGHLRSAQHQAIIEQCIGQIVGKKVRLRIVDGTTLADYEKWKEMQEAAEASRYQISRQRSEDRSIELAWEEIAEKITRGYAKLQHRQFAQSRGRFIAQCFKVINEAVNRFEYSDASDEVHKRSLARVFEKFATVVAVPSSMLAYEFFRLRDEGKLN